MALLDYIRHKPFCETQCRRPFCTDQKCDCGLAYVLEQYHNQKLEKTSFIRLTTLQRVLLVRAATVEINLLTKLYGTEDSVFKVQVAALETAIDMLDDINADDL